ncbi:MAG: glycosyltransferase [Bacteroidales bacterium]|nr:glycosyltransferase [Bacteroidales bacterium]
MHTLSLQAFPLSYQRYYFVTFVFLYAMQKTSGKHVLFLTRWYPHYYDPMFGLFVERHARAVALLHDVSVIYIHPSEQAAGSFTEVTREAHFLELKYYYPKKGFLNKVMSPLRFLKAFFKSYNKLVAMQGAPDVVHVNILTRMGFLAWLLRIRYGIPYIITEHWSRYLPRNNGYKGFLRKMMTTAVVKKASALTTVTDNLRYAMENLRIVSRYPVTVPNVVDVDFFRPPAEKENTDKTIFIHVSCFEERSKNMSGILDAVYELHKKRDDFILYMVGEGIDLEQTIRYAEEAGIKDKVVFFTGLQQGDELLKLMQRADAMVMFSHYENLPVVILEAFACGIPVISSEVGGIAEHLAPARGILIPSGDKQALVAAMETMAATSHTYNHQDIRQYAEEHFSMPVIAAQFDKLYTEATENHV